MIKTGIPGLVCLIISLLSVAQALDVTNSYRYYPTNATFLHFDANKGSFNCPIPCTSYYTATDCTVSPEKTKTTEYCSKSFGRGGAAAKICTNVVGKETKQYSCTGVDPNSKFVCSGCTAITS
ncbi:hypothetical protein PTTG_27706 [Puccinia triticina 1-1 BBBD Race 1]|uniref:Secreted protein n=2 Tax=Puccinia triticina TaxID=208348 RepID=A0A180GI25_PUCT1|nr:uncharacterized protein PtA15_8A237 [Puccinia triticina]OAV92224.1 hypothetical protein PTTG_27706 [Puccinia triticina 1-1 BBBD Race 1]WAQ87333.1 hypothetical protein PtA15_8A237 [Puccinia triticina]WAR57187.1 hypothetical protein PtB15_8B234 [Puccinia triticina]